jgi:hypothetical protein
LELRRGGRHDHGRLRELDSDLSENEGGRNGTLIVSRREDDCTPTALVPRHLPLVDTRVCF